MTDIEEAFSRLNEAFGNPSKVMNFNLKALEELGMMPSEKLPNGQLSYTKKIEWLLRLEVILAKILDLSKRNTQLAHEAFSSGTYRKLWARFPSQVLDKLVRIQGTDGSRLEAILEKIKEMRQHAQTMDDECGIPVAASKKVTPQKVTADVFFKQPEYFESCRICTHLSATGRLHQNLFENHTSNYPTGCPKFAEASMELRRTLIDKVKICPQCFHPDVVYTKAHLKDCQFSKDKKKNAYSCSVSSCKTHMWICLIHRNDNAKKMEKFRNDLQRKGINLSHTSVEELGFQSDVHAFNLASRKLRRTEKKKGTDIVAVPEGEPLFLFHGAQGKSRPINVFYDNGCSHAVFKLGVPGVELKGQLVAKGPFHIGGVGGITTVADSEWIVLMQRTDNKKQLVQGLTVPQVTSDFPMIELGSALQALKDDDPNNRILQNCKVPAHVGGSVDVLLGSKYLSVFPEPLHSLPNGLTIYKSKLSPHQSGYEFCIGGPHSSFHVLASISGGTAKLLANFTDGLQTFRQWGPPRIVSFPCTNDAVDTGKPMLTYRTLTGDEEIMAYQFNQMEDTVSVDITGEAQKPSKCCLHCKESKSNNAHLTQDRIRDFNRHSQLHDLGLDVDYRCPACRECQECKNADKTEKVSLREESEWYEIKKSVKIDLEQKQLRCTLPLMAKERDFLTCNRDRALKILTQQCRRYHGDVDTRNAIVKAFAKLFNNGHAALLKDLKPEDRGFLDKEIQYHIPWRVVFSSSPTTPIRPVLDASSRTSFRKDKSGGRSLNDIVAKGKVESINLVKVLLRFVTGSFAVVGDLKQFYNAFKLEKEQWNLQRFLWVEDLDPNGEVLEAVIKTLIYGVKSVSAQTEFALSELAKMVETSNPELARFLVLSRYVDDLQDSKGTIQECRDLTISADKLFSQVGVECKGWTISGSPPPEIVSKDSLSIGVGGFGWFPEGDILELKIPRLHFGKSRRGRLAKSVVLFEGSEENMESFVPNPLTRRQAASKLGSIWDILGKLAPLMNGIKLDLRETFKQTEDWDQGMPSDLRQKWVQNFILFEKLRGLKFQRAVMPKNAVNTKLRVLTGVDAAKYGLMMGCWGGFKLTDGTWSNKLLLGRSLLARSESIPKDELEALCGGSNMAWVVRLALQEWVESSIIFSDSMIALCWLTSEKLRLSLFHRNRVMQIRRGTELETAYHIKTENNPADCGTRPDKVKVSDVGPDSRWENGDYWMHDDVENAVSSGILKPATSLRVSKDIEDDFNQGLIFGDKDDIISGGFQANVSELRKTKLEERANFSQYILLPTKYAFPKTVRIYALVFKFLRKVSKGRKFVGPLLKGAAGMLTLFNINVYQKNDIPMATSCLELNPDRKSLVFQSTNCVVDLSEDDFQLALLYLFRKASAEVLKFNKQALVNKLAFDKDGILYSKGRLLDGMNFVETGELGNINLGSLGVKVHTPVLDRYSPLSYSIALYIHNTVGRHKGIETSNRLSLEHVSIMQGMTLFREIADDCWKCKMKRKHFLDVSMGPVAQEQLMIAPPFYVTMIDLFGPIESYVPGFERNTRNRKVLQSKMYVMVAVCVTTKIVNLQVLEGKSADNIVDGFTRLSAEVGIPSIVHVDQDAGAMAGFREAEFDFIDLKHQLHRQFGIEFVTCPKSGHHQHGLVERTIRSIQETFNDHDLKSKRLNTIGWQTFCKLAENSYNNVPFGYSYGREQDNTELLRILTPNMLRVGKINSRVIQGPIRLPVNRKELLGHVEKIYSGWFKIFKDTVVPRLIHQPKWFNLEKDLQPGDIVYFKKDDSVLGTTWKVGEVDQVVHGRDGHVRRAVIKYCVVNENDPQKASIQVTDRAARALVKLWSIDEVDLFDDLSEVQRVYDRTQRNIPENVGIYVSSIYALHCGTVVSLDEFSTSCETIFSRKSFNNYEENDFEEVTDGNLQYEALNALIMSTGFVLE